MKNVIFLVVDGLAHEMTIDLKNHPTPMKFLKALAEKNSRFDNVYSQAPYTEAGLMGLIYGKNPIDDATFYYGTQEWENSIFETFHDAGYQMFSSYYGSSMPPEMIVKGKYIYTANYFSCMFSRYLRSKLDYYKNIWDRNELLEQDYEHMVKMLYKHFESMIVLHSEIAHKNDMTNEFNPCEEGDANWENELLAWKKKVDLEYSLFKKKDKEYIDHLFDSYDSHFMTNINTPALPLSTEIKSIRKKIAKEYKVLFKKIKKKNIYYFIKNNNFQTKQLLCSMKKGGIHRFIEHFFRVIQSYFIFDTSKMLSTDVIASCSSARAFIRSFIAWHKQLEMQPFFAYLHLDEFHRPLSFYTTDTTDYELVKDELESIKAYVDVLPTNYEGNIPFDLSALYIDSCIEELYRYLTENNLTDNTILVITADHGSSNFRNKIRYTVTNNFYCEQYHIPLVISGLSEKIVSKGFYNIKDIPYTVLKECTLPIPKTFSGKSLMSDSNGFSFIEYTGSGVPDLIRKYVYYMHIDKDKTFLLRAKIIDFDSTVELLEYYDLHTDPNQYNDISKKISVAEKELYFNEWRNRVIFIKNTYY